MDIISNVIKKLDEANENDYRLDIKIGLGKNSICRWRNGQSKPSADALIKIADYFQISLDELVGRAEPTAQTTPNAVKSPLMERLANLNEIQQAKVMAYIDGMETATDNEIARAFMRGENQGRATARRRNSTAGDKMA